MPTTTLELSRARWTRPLLLLLAVVIVVAFGAWYAVHPRALATTDRVVDATVAAGTTIYVGVYAATGDDAERSLDLSGVQVRGTSSRAVSVTPLVCRGGAIGVTTDASLFCQDLLDPEGERLLPGDGVVLAITGQEPATVDLSRVRLAFREGLQWGQDDAGASVRLTILGR